MGKLMPTRPGSFHMRKFLTHVLAPCLIAVLVMAPPQSSAISSASTAESFTVHISDATEIDTALNPCLGPIVGTLTYDALVHVTTTDSTYHAVVEAHGTAVVVPIDPNEPAFTGRFAEIQTLELNPNNAVSTFTVTQLASGMEFHITFQLVLAANGGQLTVLNFSCG